MSGGFKLSTELSVAIVVMVVVGVDPSELVVVVVVGVVDVVAVVVIASGTVDSFQDVKTNQKPTIEMSNFLKFL